MLEHVVSVHFEVNTFLFFRGQSMSKSYVFSRNTHVEHLVLFFRDTPPPKQAPKIERTHTSTFDDRLPPKQEEQTRLVSRCRGSVGLPRWPTLRHERQGLCQGASSSFQGTLFGWLLGGSQSGGGEMGGGP